MTLLKDMVTIEEDRYKSALPHLSDQQKILAVRKVIDVIDSYKSSLDKSVQKLDLSNKYIKYVQNYSNYNFKVQRTSEFY